MYFPSPDGSATGNLVVSAMATIQGRDAEESSAGESGDTGGVPIIEMLEDDEGNMTNTSDGLAKVTTAASNRVNEGAEMLKTTCKLTVDIHNHKAIDHSSCCITITEQFVAILQGHMYIVHHSPNTIRQCEYAYLFQ